MRVRRAGFTLVELLVVIAIIGMLMALLFPAVQAARETGRGNTCRNNMRNLALAQYQYDNRKGFYAGIYEQLNNSANTAVFWRPMRYQLFQDLERNDLYEMYSRDNAPGNGLPQIAGASGPPPFLDLLVCPSNPIRTGTPMAYTINVCVWTPDGSSYLLAPWAGLVFFNANYQIPGSSPPAFVNQNFNNGSAYVSANDGTATTVIFSENIGGDNTYVSSSWNGRGFIWGDYSPTQQRDFAKINAANKATTGATAQTIRPSSNHPQSVNMAFCDTHVRVIRDTIAYRVYAHLCTPRGRQQEPNPSSPTPSNYDFVRIWDNALSESDL